MTKLLYALTAFVLLTSAAWRIHHEYVDAKIGRIVSEKWNELHNYIDRTGAPQETACPFYQNNRRWLPEGTQASWDKVCAGYVWDAEIGNAWQWTFVGGGR